ncbi:MAG: secretin N-terminal domain-containing protein [Planctomycetota bacterium]
MTWIRGPRQVRPRSEARAGSRTFVFVTLENARASETLTVFHTVFRSGIKSGQLRIAADVRTNTMVLSGAVECLEEAQSLAKKLDAMATSESRQASVSSECDETDS